MMGLGVARILSGVLIFQLGIGVLLILGDIGGSWRWPGTGSSDAPGLEQPVRPGDQRRLFDPRRQPGPARDADMPERLTLTHVEGGTYRLRGTIARDDAARIAGLLRSAAPAPETLVLHSPGGLVHEALALGRTIRAEALATRVEAGEYCFSACPYLLAAGRARTVSPEAAVGVHQHYFDESTVLPAAFAVDDIQRGQAEVLVFLDTMGIDPMLMQHIMGTPPEEIYILLPEQLVQYGFIDAD